MTLLLLRRTVMANTGSEDIFVSRVIRKAITELAAAEKVEDKLNAIGKLAAVAAVATLSNRQMVQATLRYIETRV
jgi:hypothetical protein